MERTYWLEWENFLEQNGLKAFVSDLLANSCSLVVSLSPVLFLGFPLFKSLPWSGEYKALADTLSDRQRLEEFSNFLKEVGG